MLQVPNTIAVKKVLLLAVMGLIIISPNYYIFNLHEESQIGTDFVIADIKDISATSWRQHNSKDKTWISSSTNMQNTQEEMSTQALIDPSAIAFIDTQTTDSSTGFRFEYQESVFNNTQTEKSNNFDFKVSPVNGTGYDSIEIDVDTYIPENSYEIEKQTGTGKALTDTTILAQGKAIDILNSTAYDSKAYVSMFNVTISQTFGSDISVIGEVWSATGDDIDIYPGAALQSDTQTVTGTDTLITFTFSNPTAITIANTHSNETAGYVFFVIRQSGTSGVSPGALGALHSLDGVDDGLTLSNSTLDTLLPDELADWDEEAFDFAMCYDAYFEIDPRYVETRISQPITDTGSLVLADGIYTNNTFVDASHGLVEYRVSRNTGLDTDYLVLFNVSYTKTRITEETAMVRYIVSPNNDTIGWRIMVDNDDTSPDTLIKHFLIPDNFTVLAGYLNSGAKDSLDYTVSDIPGINQTVTVNDVTIGNYTIVASTPNLLQYASVSNNVWDVTNKVWDNNNTAKMGIAPATDGDIINSQISDPSTWLAGGDVYSSLRDETGTIINTPATIPFVDKVNYTTTLGPNLDVGTYSFQHIWFNGTAAAAIFQEIAIYPQTELTLRDDPLVYNVKQGDPVEFWVTTADLSHADGWDGVTGLADWGDASKAVDDITPETGYNNYTETINTASFTEGTYTVNITFTEGIYTDFILFTIIIDETDPIVSGVPATTDFTEQGVNGQILEWTATDVYPGAYSIEWNGTVSGDFEELESGTWDSGVPEDTTLGELDRGWYRFRVTFWDEAGNSDIEITDVLVEDLAVPFIVANNNITDYVEGSVGNNITWSVQDNHPDYYTVAIDDEIVPGYTSSWSGTEIEINVDGLDKGTHTLEITIYDDSGNPASDKIWITVLDETAPVIESYPERNSTKEDEDLKLNWTAYDLHPGSYRILQNDTEMATGQWSVGTNITYTVSGLPVGTYNFTIIILDDSGNDITSTLLFEVKDPEIKDTQSVSFTIVDQVYEGTVETINLSWLDIDGDLVPGATAFFRIIADDIPSNESLNGETIKEYQIDVGTDGTFVLALDYFGLLPGDYHWSISFNSENYDGKSVNKPFTILPHNVIIDIDPDDEFIQGEPFRILLNVTYANSPSSLGLDAITSSRQGGADNVSLQVEIKFVDAEGNPQSLTFDETIVGLGNGAYLLEIIPDTTQTITDIISIGAQVTEVTGYNTNQFLALDSDIPEVQLSEEGIADIWESIYKIITDNLELFIGIVFVLLVVITLILVQTRRRREKIKLYNRLKVQTVDEIKGLLNMHAVVMKSRVTGLQFYERVFEDTMSLDTALLAGITTAITNVLSEIKEGEKGFETMQRQGLSITSYVGDFLTTVVVSQEELPDLIKSQIADFHHAFEEKHKETEENTHRLNFIPNKEINEMLGVYMKFGLKENLRIDVKQIDKIKDKKSINRKVRRNMSTLKGLQLVIEEANLPLTLYSIFEYLKTKEIPDDQAFQIIATGYAYGIINSDTD